MLLHVQDDIVDVALLGCEGAAGWEGAADVCSVAAVLSTCRQQQPAVPAATKRASKQQTPTQQPAHADVSFTAPKGGVATSAPTPTVCCWLLAELRNLTIRP